MVGLLPRRANKYVLIPKWIQPAKKFNALSTSLFVTYNDSHEIVRSRGASPRQSSAFCLGAPPGNKAGIIPMRMTGRGFHERDEQLNRPGAFNRANCVHGYGDCGRSGPDY